MRCIESLLKRCYYPFLYSVSCIKGTVKLRDAHIEWAKEIHICGNKPCETQS